MRGLTLLFALSFSLAYGQNNEQKASDFLRDYKAPDFKQRSLGLTFSATGYDANGSIYQDSRVYQGFGLRYSQYSNSQKYQGMLLSALSSNINWRKDLNGESFSVSSGIYLLTENRFYFKPKWFLGLHGNVYLEQTYYKKTGNPSISHFDFEYFTPILSVGNGRLEPVHYARNAMDIEKQLKIGNRLVGDYSAENLKIIADELAKINNVRFYDFRLRRIEQFKALDKVLKAIGGISEFDIEYFVHLADAYLYAKNFPRYSGFRQELGVAPIGGFYALTYELPASYAVQHAFNANTTGAVEQGSFGAPTEFIVTASGGYELGWYPTTRTNINIGAQVGAELNNLEVGGKVFANGDIYFSPRFRLNFETGIIVGTGNVAPDLNYILKGQDLVQDGHRFNIKIGLNYAIF